VLNSGIHQSKLSELYFKDQTNMNIILSVLCNVIIIIHIHKLMQTVYLKSHIIHIPELYSMLQR